MERSETGALTAARKLQGISPEEEMLSVFLHVWVVMVVYTHWNPAKRFKLQEGEVLGQLDGLQVIEK